MPGIVVDAVRVASVPQAATGPRRTTEAVGALPATVVVALGTNGRVTAEAIDAIMRAAGRDVRCTSSRCASPGRGNPRSMPRCARGPNVGPTRMSIDWHEFATATTTGSSLDGFHLSTTRARDAYADPDRVGDRPLLPTTHAADDRAALDVVDVRWPVRDCARHRLPSPAVTCGSRPSRAPALRRSCTSRAATRSTTKVVSTDRCPPRGGLLDRGRRRHVLGRGRRRRWCARDDSVEDRRPHGHGRVHEDPHRNAVLVPDRRRERGRLARRERLRRRAAPLADWTVTSSPTVTLPERGLRARPMETRAAARRRARRRFDRGRRSRRRIASSGSCRSRRIGDPPVEPVTAMSGRRPSRRSVPIGDRRHRHPCGRPDLRDLRQLGAGVAIP